MDIGTLYQTGAQILVMLLGGGLLHGIWEYMSTRRTGSDSLRSKRTPDESELSKILLEHTRENHRDMQQSLISQIEDLRKEADDLQRRLTNLMEQALEREKVLARQEIRIEALEEENKLLRERVAKLTHENDCLRSGEVHIHTHSHAKDPE